MHFQLCNHPANRLTGLTQPPEPTQLTHPTYFNHPLKQDKDETPESLRAQLPVVSLSLGDAADFAYGSSPDADAAGSVRLESGDLLVFGGPGRMVFHAVRVFDWQLIGSRTAWCSVWCGCVARSCLQLGARASCKSAVIPVLPPPCFRLAWSRRVSPVKSARPAQDATRLTHDTSCHVTRCAGAAHLPAHSPQGTAGGHRAAARPAESHFQAVVQEVSHTPRQYKERAVARVGRGIRSEALAGLTCMPGHTSSRFGCAECSTATLDEHSLR